MKKLLFCAVVLNIISSSMFAMDLNAPPGFEIDDWGSFSKRIYLSGVETKVEVAHVSYKTAVATAVPTDFWVLKRSIRTRGHGIISTAWATSLRCSTLLTTFAKLKNLEQISLTPPEATSPDQELVAVADGAAYTLDAPGQYSKELTLGRVHYEVGSMTPISVWVDQAIIDLEPCWNKSRPTLKP